MKARPPARILASFGATDALAIEPLGSGHIHTAWRVTVGSGERLVLQQLNSRVFHDVELLAANAKLITDRLRAAGVPTLALRASSTGALLAGDGDAQWRAYAWVDGHTSSEVSSFDEIDRVARAFGAYAAALRDVEQHELRPTIDSFHDFDARVQQLHTAYRTDLAGRAASVRADVDRCLHLVDRLCSQPEHSAWLALPDRVAHNDAKLANAVISATGGVCVIDLDTTMAGPILADVGELVRSCTSPATRAGLAAAAPHPERVDRIVRAWLEGWDAPLDAVELAALPIAGAMLTLENAIRFLADYFDGDGYFRVDRPGENLDRFRAQVAHAQVQVDALDDVRLVVGRASRRTH